MFLIPLFYIDAKHKILPDLFTLSILCIGIILNYFCVFKTLKLSILGAIFGYISLWSIFWIYKFFTGKDGFGYGDFKLLAAIGAWFGYSMIFYTIFFSCIFGIIISIIINIIVGKTNIIPFGPAIILATFFYLLTKDNIYVWYNNTILINVY